MEARLSYAVVLDDEGRFAKVPNLGYSVGDTLEDVCLFDEVDGDPAEILEIDGDRAPERRSRRRRVLAWLATAACLAVVAVGGVTWQMPLGTVHMSINPDVAVEVNRFDRVIGLRGDNADGEALIDGYWSYGKTSEEVALELAERAWDGGYLVSGGVVAIDVSSDDDGWRSELEDRLIVELDEALDPSIAVGTSADIEAMTADIPEVIELEPVESEPSPTAAPPATSQAPAAPGPAPAGDSSYASGSSGYDSSSGYDGGSGYEASSGYDD